MEDCVEFFRLTNMKAIQLLVFLTALYIFVETVVYKITPAVFPLSIERYKRHSSRPFLRGIK